MKWDVALRVVGVIGIVAAYAVYKYSSGMTLTGLTVTFTAILSIVAPEVLSQLPWGPTK